MSKNDLNNDFQEQIFEANKTKETLNIVGGNSKKFLGRTIKGISLDTKQHSGIINYEASELVLTVRAGTTITEINQALIENNQILAFDPPQYSISTTIGGAIASGLSGPGRPWQGSARDMVLGLRIVDGKGQLLKFGGQVMKNVAGYDVSRLMTGAFGTLGLISEVSLKVLPAPQIEKSISLNIDRNTAQATLKKLSNQATPLSGSCYEDNHLFLRFSGSPSAVNTWVNKMDKNNTEHDLDYWRQLRDQQLDFFNSDKPLWRLSLPATTPKLNCEADNTLVDWAGAQRWFHSTNDAESIFKEAVNHAGHASSFRNGDRNAAIFQPLDKINTQIQQGIKNTFDPHGILNSGRISPIL